MSLTILFAASLAGCSTGGLGVSEVQIAGSKTSPLTFAEQDRAVVASGLLTGLESTNVSITVAVSGWAYGVCTQDGRVRSPATNPVRTEGFGWMNPVMEPSVRRVAFEVTAAAAMPDLGRFGCPDASWTVGILEVSFTEAHLTVTQDSEVAYEADFRI